MTINERFEASKKAGAEVQKPPKLLGLLDEKSAHAHLDAKIAAFAEGALPLSPQR